MLAGSEQAQQAQLAKLLHRRGRTDWAETMQDRQRTTQIIQVRGKEPHVNVNVNSFSQLFQGSGLESNQVQYQIKTLKFPNQFAQFYPGDYIELQGRFLMRLRGDREEGGTFKDIFTNQTPVSEGKLVRVEPLEWWKFPIKLPLRIDRPTQASGEQLVDILNKSIRYLLIDSIEQYVRGNTTDIGTNPYLPHVLNETTQDYNDENGDVTRLIMLNILRNTRFRFDHNSGKLQMVWTAPDDNVHFSFPFSIDFSYIPPDRIIHQHVAGNSLATHYVNGGTIPFLEAYGNKVMIPSNTFVDTTWPSGSHPAQHITSKMIQTYVEIRVGSELSDKRREILSQAIGLEPLSLQYRAPYDINQAIPGWTAWDESMQYMVNIEWYNSTVQFVNQQAGSISFSSPYSIDLVPFKEIYVYSNLESNHWYDNRKVGYIQVVHVSNDIRDIPREKEFIGDFYKTNEDINSMKNMTFTFKDRWGEVMAFDTEYFMEIAVFLK